MKKLIIALFIVCFIVTPAFAGHHHHRHHNRDFAVGLILGAATGAIIVGNHGHHRHYRESRWYYQQSRYPQYRRYRPMPYAGVCQDFPVRNQWGEIIRIDTYCR